MSMKGYANATISNDLAQA